MLFNPLEEKAMKKEYTVIFADNRESDYQDEEQALLVRLIKNDHPILYGEQNHFNNYIKRARRNIAKDLPWYDRKKADTPWETVEVYASNEIAKADMDTIFTVIDTADKPVLDKREQNYLTEFLNGNKNNEIVDTMNISGITGKRIKGKIISKLKSWNKKDELKTLYQTDPSELHGTDISDLRYRIIPLTLSQVFENEEKIKNSIQEVKKIEIKDKNYTWKKKNYSGKITAPVVAKPAKKPDNVWYAIPTEDFTKDHGVTIGKMRNIKIEYDALVYARSHIPEFFVTPNKRDILCEKPVKKPAMVEAEKIETDYYETDIRLINRR